MLRSRKGSQPPQARPWLGLPWWGWALGCLVVASIYLVVEEPHRPGWVGWWLRWGHSTCWFLLALSFLWRLTPWRRLASRVAGTAGLAYGLYLLAKLGLI